MNYFNLLSPEIIEFIFKKLNLNDLINLRIVDKRFRQICEQFKIKQLYLSNQLQHFSSFWFLTNDPTYFNNENSIGFSKFQNYATIFQLDKHLKRLSINFDNFDLTILNQFQLLEQLDVIIDELKDNYKLSLDHLRIVDFFMYTCDFKLTFDTIKLFAVRLMNENYKTNNNIIFNYPNEILHLEIDYNNNWPLFYNDSIEIFNNLKYLKLSCLYESIDRNVLSQLKNLEILDLSLLCYEQNDNLFEDIKFLINEKENLRRSELEIYSNGIKLINQNQINQIKLSNSTKYKRFEFQIKNYDLLKDNCDNCKINYCDLIKLIKIIPSSFTNKLPFIHQVKANDHIANEDQFIKFLIKIPYLSKLELINCELTKSFYDQLMNSVYLNDLKHLTIEEKNDLEMNFDFILNLKQLEHFQTNQIIANHIDLIYELSKQNEIIKGFFFKFDLKNYIKIYKQNDGLFIISSYYLNDISNKVDNFPNKVSKDLDDVISKLKELKI